MLDKCMAFYSKLLDGDEFKLSEEEAREWRRDLPKAVEAQHFLIDRGCLLVPMNLANGRKLKTLDVSNALAGSICWNSLGDASGSTARVGDCESR